MSPEEKSLTQSSNTFTRRSATSLPGNHVVPSSFETDRPSRPVRNSPPESFLWHRLNLLHGALLPLTQHHGSRERYPAPAQLPSTTEVSSSNQEGRPSSSNKRDKPIDSQPGPFADEIRTNTPQPYIPVQKVIGYQQNGMPITGQDELLAKTRKREELELKLKESKEMEELKEELENTKSSGCAGKVLFGIAFGAWYFGGGGEVTA